MLNEDNVGYLHFTGPMRIEKQLHTLEGLLTGLAADGAVTAKEVAALAGWTKQNQEFRSRHPFTEILPQLENALRDGVLDDEERADLLWMCDSLKPSKAPFCKITVDLQRLHGILGGIAADGEITVDELQSLQSWLEGHEHLKACWPFDEIESIIMTVLRDGQISEQEHRGLLTFFNEFANFGEHRAIDIPENWDEFTIQGVCSVCPEIVFDERMFCFTGKSERYTRKKFAEIISSRGGFFSNTVNHDVDYLIIGADGNPCWAFACYGRKVEQAISNRRNGHNIL